MAGNAELRMDDDDTPTAANGSEHPAVLLNGHRVVRHLEVADTMASRMVGLLGRRGIEQGGGLWITPCSSIHMLFMRFAIDVVFLDRDHQVVRVHEDVRPWRFARGGRHAHSVLELPQGTIAFHNVRVGERLQLVGV